MRESVDAQVPVGIAGDKPAMALRIAVAVFAALRAVLVYGEAARLTTEPLRLPPIRRGANSAPALIDAHRLSASNLTAARLAPTRSPIRVASPSSTRTRTT